ncbi:MAG: hypothetical protein HZB26_00670 [Candidatus Hydrogenedentes bacterium]|nr:hypothetical protein [Candidatus Hydrogenedentota bacterium]
MSTAYNDLYNRIFGHQPPDSVIIGESDADILSPGRGFMDGFHYTMQLMVGCPGGCLFCYVPTGYMLAPSAVKGPHGSLWGYVLRNKNGVLAKLRAHLAKGTIAGKTLYWSGVTDPYASSPKITRGVWEALCDAAPELRPGRIAVQSRFRPDRDAEFVTEYARQTQPSDGGPAVVYSYSIGTDRNDLIDAWERATPSFDQRMACVAKLRQAGLFVVMTLSPFGPWNDLPGALEQFKALGVAYITALFLKCGTRSANTPKLFREYLQENYPYLLDEQWQHERVQEMQSVFGVDRVIVGQDGFLSLTRPHLVGANG